MKLTRIPATLAIMALAVGQTGCCCCRKKEPVYVPPAPMCPAPVASYPCPPGGAPAYTPISNRDGPGRHGSDVRGARLLIAPRLTAARRRAAGSAQGSTTRLRVGSTLLFALLLGERHGILRGTNLRPVLVGVHLRQFGAKEQDLRRSSTSTPAVRQTSPPRHTRRPCCCVRGTNRWRICRL